MGSAGSGIGNLTEAATSGATSGLGSKIGGNAAPEELKPYAAAAGGILVPCAIQAVGAAARSVLRVPINALASYAGPATGRMNPLMDATRAQFTTDAGVPLAGTANQLQMAGDRVRAVMSDPAAVQNASSGAPAPVITADGRPAGPTTFQLKRNPGLEHGPAASCGRVSRSSFPGAGCGAE